MSDASFVLILMIVLFIFITPIIWWGIEDNEGKKENKEED